MSGRRIEGSPPLRVDGSAGSAFRRPVPPWEKQSLHVDGVAQDAGALHRLGSLRTGRQRAGLFERCQRFGFQIELRLWVFDRSSHDCSATWSKLDAPVRGRSSRQRPIQAGRWPPSWFRCGRISGIRSCDARNPQVQVRRQPLPSAYDSRGSADGGLAIALDRVSASPAWRKANSVPKPPSVRCPTNRQNNLPRLGPGYRDEHRRERQGRPGKVASKNGSSRRKASGSLHCAFMTVPLHF
jgi:hypothetical protein